MVLRVNMVTGMTMRGLRAKKGVTERASCAVNITPGIVALRPPVFSFFSCLLSTLSFVSAMLSSELLEIPACAMADIVRIVLSLVNRPALNCAQTTKSNRIESVQ